MTRPLSAKELHVRAQLEAAHGLFHRPEYLATDPLQVAHRYTDPADQEVAALLAAAFASGNIKSIMAALESLLAVMGPRPAAWLMEHSPAQLHGRLAGFRHRWVTDQDAELLCALLGEALRRHGTLGALWQGLDEPARPTTIETLGDFVEAILALPVEPLARRARVAHRRDGASHELPSIETILLTSPRNGSACKRMHLFLRWMVRPADGIDLGLWTRFVHPARLMMPIDTHVLQQTKKLGLTREKLPTAKACEQITARMRRLSPDDPCRYDFTLVRMGITG